MAIGLNSAKQRTGTPRQTARQLGCRHHWTVAKALAPSIETWELRGWFSPFMIAEKRLPACPHRRLLWLISARAAFRGKQNTVATLRVNAAIWSETQRLRRTRCGNPRLPYQTNPATFRQSDAPTRQ